MMKKWVEPLFFDFPESRLHVTFLRLQKPRLKPTLTSPNLTSVSEASFSMTWPPKPVETHDWTILLQMSRVSTFSRDSRKSKKWGPSLKFSNIINCYNFKLFINNYSCLWILLGQRRTFGAFGWGGVCLQGPPGRNHSGHVHPDRNSGMSAN